jgi:hypothetical protein
MAAVAGVLVAMMGILPTFRARLGATATGTSAFAAVEPLATTLVELGPLVILALAAGFVLYGTGVLGVLR